MTFKVYGEIEIDGKAARVEIKGVDEALEKAARGADKFSFSGKGAAGGMGKLKGETTLAAGSVANLGAQFNDIGVMLAAGQNPLQLAIQQGTQITQVFGNAGAASRVAMLKQAFLSVVSPANLMTIGVIAGGAALVQWGMNALRAGEDADVLAEKMEKVTERQRSLSEELRRLALGVTEEELTLLDQIAQKRREVQEAESRVETGGSGRNLRPIVERLKLEQDALAALMAQLDELRRLESQRTALISGAREMADAERLVGENVSKTVKEVEEAEAMTRLLKDGIKASVIEAMILAGIDITSPMSSAADEAARIASNLGIAYEAAVKLQQQRAMTALETDSLATQYSLYGEGRQAANDLIRNSDPLFGGELGNVLPPPRPTRGGTRSRGGASQADQERQAVDDLVRSLQEQLDLVRELDPVQKEMIRNRETLKAATDAEKQSVEQLIASRIAEEAAIERATDNAEAFKDISWEALDGLLFRSENAADAVANLADMLAQAAAQSLLLGTGPLAGLFGTKDSGGLLGMIGTALFPGASVGPGKAAGGMIYGMGGPRDDTVLTPTSAGEFIVNAQATAQNRALLEYINGGGLNGREGFAAGGMPIPVPMPMTQGGGAGSQGRVVISLAPSPLFDARVIEASQGVFVEGMQEYRSQGLPSDVERISLDPGRRG